MRLQPLIFTIVCVSLFSTSALAGSLTLHIGPEQIGAGGSSPIAIPPNNPYQWAFTWVGDSGSEGTLSLCPGLVYGYRFKADSFYVSTGGGLIINYNGAGLGPYASFGYTTGKGSKGPHFTASYTHAVGIANGKALASSAMRFGVLWEY